jgi:hypothetical protein
MYVFLEVSSVVYFIYKYHIISQKSMIFKFEFKFKFKETIFEGLTIMGIKS